MTVPVPALYTTTDDTSRTGNTLAVNIPAGVVAGDVLYVVVADYVDNGFGDELDSITFPSGWTKFWGASDNFRGYGVCGAGAWKYADGTESGTISVDLDALTAGGLAIMYRITGAINPALRPPSVGYQPYNRDIVAVGPTVPGPPVYVDTKQPEDVLAFTCAIGGGGTITFSQNPENYAELEELSVTGMKMRIGHRNCEGALMEMPTEWRYNIFGTNYDWIAATALFYPLPENRFEPPADYPWVRAWKETREAGHVTSTTFRLQLPEPLVPGDVLLALIVQYRPVPDDVNGITTWPDEGETLGWTELFEVYAERAGGGQHTYVAAAWKKVDGTETRSIYLPTIADVPTMGVCFAIANAADPDIYPPEYQDSNFNSGTFLELTPSWGSAKCLWLAFCGHQSVSEFWGSDDIAGNGWRYTSNGSAAGCMTSWADDRFGGRFWAHGNNYLGTGQPYMSMSWAQIEASSVLPGAQTIIPTAGSGAYSTSATAIAFYPGPFEPCFYYHLGRHGKGRGGTL